MLRDIALILGGYLLGSIPFAFLITKAVTGRDIRFEGEGNVGARNVLHVAGPMPGLLTVLLDGAKGAAAYWLAETWGSGNVTLYLTGAALLVGHGFPVWLSWRGGKGLAAAAGFLLQMWPWSLLATLVILVVARSVIPDFNLSVTVAGTLFPFLTFWEGNDLEGLLFIIFFLGLTGVKKVLDLPHEKAIRDKSGWHEGLHRTRDAHR